MLATRLAKLAEELTPLLGLLTSVVLSHNDDESGEIIVDLPFILRALHTGYEIFVQYHLTTPVGLALISPPQGNGRFLHVQFCQMAPQILNTICNTMLKVVNKIKVEIPEKMSHELAACLASGFEQVGRLKNETLIQGLLQDKILLERLHPRWQRSAQESLGEEINLEEDEESPHVQPAPNESYAAYDAGSVTEQPAATAAVDEYFQSDELHLADGIFRKSGGTITQLPTIRTISGANAGATGANELHAEHRETV